MLNTFALKPAMKLGDLVAVADGRDSEAEVREWLDRHAPRRVQLNRHIMRLCTRRVDANRTLTVVRVGAPL